MSQSTNTSGSASSVVVEGLAELTREQKLERIKQLEAAKKARGKAEKARADKLARLIAFRDGVVDPKLNPKGRHNPTLVPETLRQTSPDELINGLPAKGWAVTIRCEICGEEREINTQDAFQVRFCEEHKAEASKAKAKERRAAKKTAKVAAELAELTDEQVAEELAKLTAQAA